MTVETVDPQDFSLWIILHCGAIIRKCRANLRGELQYASLRKRRKHGVSGGEELERAAHRDRGAILAFDAGCADDQSSPSAGHDIDGVAGVQESQHVAEFDLRGM